MKSSGAFLLVYRYLEHTLDSMSLLVGWSSVLLNPGMLGQVQHEASKYHTAPNLVKII